MDGSTTIIGRNSLRYMEHTPEDVLRYSIGRLDSRYSGMSYDEIKNDSFSSNIIRSIERELEERLRELKDIQDSYNAARSEMRHQYYRDEGKLRWYIEHMNKCNLIRKSIEIMLKEYDSYDKSTIHARNVLQEFDSANFARQRRY